MSGLLTSVIVAERYGLRLDVEKLSEVTGLKPQTIRNQISAESFPIPTYVEAGKRWADYRDVAAHIDACRDRAKATH